jgi:predicted transposase/invertase (TIGR01784 family)
MRVNRQRVALEVQVADEKDYPERSLYYWAREYSTALKKGKQYRRLPRAIIISILAFNLFDCKEFYSEFQALEVKRHTPLTDKMRLCYFELRKLPKIIGADDELKLWLNLFKAETEEDLQQIEELGVPIMEQAIKAYRQTKTTEKFMELERMRELTQHNEASALDYARREARREAKKAEREKWQAALAEKDTALAEKDTALAENAVLIAELREQLEKSKKGVGEN